MNNYTLTTNGNSSVFTPSALQPLYTGSDPNQNAQPTFINTIYYPFYRSSPSFVLSSSADGLRVYTRSTTSTVDQLILSSNTVPIVRSAAARAAGAGSPPGSGNADIVLSYVGFGSWFSGTVSGSNVTGNIDYFTYGAFSTDGALPRTGTASYLFTLDGRLATNSVYYVTGEGVLTANFGTGAINFHTDMLTEYSPSLNTGSSPPAPFVNGAIQYPFQGSAMIASNMNRFSGTFDYHGSATLSGTIDGRFYGPNVEEVGATFSGQSTGAALVGALVGSHR